MKKLALCIVVALGAPVGAPIFPPSRFTRTSRSTPNWWSTSAARTRKTVHICEAG